MAGLQNLADVQSAGLKSRLSVLEDQPIRLAVLAIVGLIGLCWLAFFNGLGSLGLMDKTEALFVEVGHQMLLRNDWVTPWWNGSTFFDYPVWGYWMVALSFRLFGVSEAAARLPVALAASAVVLATFGLLLLWAPAWESRLKAVARAGLAAGVLATTPAWIGWGRTSTTDMFLSSAITLALFSYLVAERDPSNRRLIALGRAGMACFAGIAVLAKGPVGLLLPALVIGADLLVRGHWARWLRPFPLAAMTLLFCGIALPWYAAATASMVRPSWAASSASATWSASPACSMTTLDRPGSTCPGWCCCCCPGRHSCPRRSPGQPPGHWPAHASPTPWPCRRSCCCGWS